MGRDKSKYRKYFNIIGCNIRNIRIGKNISQEELAFRISSARNYIGCIERGEKFPSISMLIDISQVLGCSLSDIVKNV